MIYFQDGPCAGMYETKRAPIFLRGVLDPQGNKSVLDLLDDEPSPNETVYVYRQVRKPTVAFVCGRSGGGQTVLCDYRHVPDVDEDLVRDTPSWRQWVNEQVDEELDMETGRIKA